MPKYIVTIPVAFHLYVEVETDEQINSDKKAHELACARLGKPDGMHRIVLITEDGKECQCAEPGELEMPVNLVTGNVTHVWCDSTSWEPVE